MSLKKNDIYICGDVNIDIMIPDTFNLPEKGQELVINNIFSFIGGGAALTSLGLAKLGANVDFEGVIADDMYGNYIISELRRAGVNTEHLHFSNENRTGISLSFTDKSDRCFVTYRGTNSEVDLKSISMSNVENARFIHLTGYSGKERHLEYYDLLKEIKKHGTKVSFDLGWDDSGEWYEGIEELFPYIDILFMNETELKHYSRKESVEEGMKKFGRPGLTVVIKCGAKGSKALRDGKIYSCDGLKVDAKDTTGAGDSFNAGVLYGELKGAGIEKALMYGNICGALSTTQFGGNTSFPDIEQLKEKYNELIGGENI